MEGIVKNTLVFSFPEKSAAPSLAEMARFVKVLNADVTAMESTYRITDERCMCIKFATEAAMKDALLQNAEVQQFQYSNGTAVEITMSVAGGCLRYVRVFDLPPEVSDLEISLVLGKYGVIKRSVREKFPAEFELNMYTGVRGVYMVIKKEIPATLYFQHRRGRVYYEGLRHKCFLCKQDGHLKADCPRKSATVIIQPETSVPRAGSSYADALKSKPTAATAGEKEELNLVALTPRNRVSSLSGKPMEEGNGIPASAPEQGCSTQEKDEENPERIDAAEDSTMDAEVNDADKTTKRKHVSDGRSTTDSEEELLKGFTEVETARKSRSRKAARSNERTSTNVLKFMADSSIAMEKKGLRKSSK